MSSSSNSWQLAVVVLALSWLRSWKLHHVPDRLVFQSTISSGCPFGVGASTVQTFRWHVLTLLEAIEYVDHELLMNRFHVTHYGGCAVLFNKDTFFPDVKVKFVYLHDIRRVVPDYVMEGDSGWVLQGVLPRASYRRQPPNGHKTFTVLSPRISNIYAKKRGKGKKLILTIRAVMLDEEVDLVDGDFNGAAWRCDNRNNISTNQEAFPDCALPMPPVSIPLWGLGAIPGMWADVCGFL